MTASNYNKYDKDFKKSLSHLTKTVNPRPSYAKNTASPNPLLANGSNSTPPLKWMTAKSLLQNGKRTTKTQCTAGGGKPHPKKRDCYIHASLKQRLDAVHKLRF